MSVLVGLIAGIALTAAGVIVVSFIMPVRRPAWLVPAFCAFTLATTLPVVLALADFSPVAVAAGGVAGGIFGLWFATRSNRRRSRTR